jgi:hypothetical protein
MIEGRVVKNSDENGMIMIDARKEEAVIHEMSGIEKGSTHNSNL